MKNFRNLFFISIILVTLNSCGTMKGVKATPESKQFEQIINVAGKDKNQLYVDANSWFVETFNSAESVIEFQDKEAGKILGKYIFSYNEGVYGYNMKQTVDISIKDEKVKVKIYNPLFLVTSGMGEKYNNTRYRILETQKGVDRARLEWTKLFDSLDKRISTSSNDNW